MDYSHARGIGMIEEMHNERYFVFIYFYLIQGVPRQVRMTASGTRKVGRSQEEVQGALPVNRHMHSLEGHMSKREGKSIYPKRFLKMLVLGSQAVTGRNKWKTILGRLERA